MNRTQNTALASLIIWLLFLVFGLIMLFEIVAFKTIYPNLHRLFLIFMIISFVFGLIFMFKKQSPKEVESDERDKLIQLKAALAGSVAGWLMLAAAILISYISVGVKGSISVLILTLIIMITFLFMMMVYWVVILVQYGFGGKKNE